MLQAQDHTDEIEHNQKLTQAEYELKEEEEVTPIAKSKPVEKSTQSNQEEPSTPTEYGGNNNTNNK